MKKNVISLLSSLFLLLTLSPIGGISIGEIQLGHDVLLVVAALTFTILTIWRLSNSDNKKMTLLMLCLPPALIFIPVHIIYFSNSTASLSSAIFHFVGILFGALIHHSKQKSSKVVLASVIACCCVLMYFKGYSLVFNKLTYGTFTGRIEKQAPLFSFEDEKGNILTNKDFKDKTLVIDFWATSCGECFRKFPIVEDLRSKIKARKDIYLVAVNVKLKGDEKEKSVQMIRDRGYNFDIFFAEQKPTNQQFEFNTYPITFIIEGGSKLTFKGDIKDAGAFLGY